jgi:hypothetical protein
MRGLMERERRLERLDGAIALGLVDAEARRVQEIEAVRRELRSAAAESPPNRMRLVITAAATTPTGRSASSRSY